jgi:hypothetical protein
MLVGDKYDSLEAVFDIPIEDAMVLTSSDNPVIIAGSCLTNGFIASANRRT